MKRIILMMVIIGAAGLQAQGQTNRNYKTDMSTERIYAEERRGGVPDQTVILLNKGSNNQEVRHLEMNQTQEFQGNRIDLVTGETLLMNQTLQFQGNVTPVLDPNDLRYKQYDTSKNNGHCLGCGSGASWKAGIIGEPIHNDYIQKPQGNLQTTRQPGIGNTATFQMNQNQQFQGNRIKRFGPNHTPATIDRMDLPYRSRPYDTTKNNGHCLGCGSGTMTDHHRFKW